MIARNQQQQSGYSQHRITPQQRPFQSRGLLSPNFSDSDTAWGVISESETEPELANLHLNIQRRDFIGVQTAPTFKTGLRNLKLTEGTDAILECQVVGNPKPQVTQHSNSNRKQSFQIYWLKNDKIMHPQGTQRIQFSYKGSIVMLRILEVIASDAGQVPAQFT